jgi:hypothetical protein
MGSNFTYGYVPYGLLRTGHEKVSGQTPSGKNCLDEGPEKIPFGSVAASSRPVPLVECSSQEKNGTSSHSGQPKANALETHAFALG